MLIILSHTNYLLILIFLLFSCKKNEKEKEEQGESLFPETTTEIGATKNN